MDMEDFNIAMGTQLPRYSSGNFYCVPVLNKWGGQNKWWLDDFVIGLFDVFVMIDLYIYENKWLSMLTFILKEKTKRYTV